MWLKWLTLSNVVSEMRWQPRRVWCMLWIWASMAVRHCGFGGVTGRRFVSLFSNGNAYHNVPLSILILVYG